MRKQTLIEHDRVQRLDVILKSFVRTFRYWWEQLFKELFPKNSHRNTGTKLIKCQERLLKAVGLKDKLNAGKGKNHNLLLFSAFIVKYAQTGLVARALECQNERALCDTIKRVFEHTTKYLFGLTF